MQLPGTFVAPICRLRPSSNNSAGAAFTLQLYVPPSPLSSMPLPTRRSGLIILKLEVAALRVLN